MLGKGNLIVNKEKIPFFGKFPGVADPVFNSGQKGDESAFEEPVKIEHQIKIFFSQLFS
jgi:hypothetical protein